MVPAPSCAYTWDYWTSSTSDHVELICLMPNSVYIPLTVSWDATLQDVKEELWDLAGKFPLFGMLHEMSGYVFQFINSLAVTEEVDDENKRLRDIKPVCGVLVIIERSIERPGEHLLNTHISNLIGKGLNEFDSLRSSEVNDFRMRMRYLAEESMNKRALSTRLERLRYRCPPRLADSPSVPTTLISHLNNNCFILVTKVANTEFSFTSNVPVSRTPQQHIDMILKKKVNSLNMRGEDPRNYVLKVCGREEYLFGKEPLIQFLYIQEMLAKDGVPQVMTVSTDKLTLGCDNPVERRPLPPDYSNTIRKKKNNHESSWNIDKNYTCMVQSVGGLNVDPGRLVEVVCQAGIFHGGKALCEAQKTRVAPVSKEGVALWDEELTFPIKVYNMPRMARLCFVIYEISKTKGKRRGKDSKDSINKLAWANTMIFDYKEQLRTDGLTLFMWTHVADETQGDDWLLHPLGTVVSNPNTDSCAALQVRFSNFDCQFPILFPKQETVKAYADDIELGSPDVIARLSRDFEQLRATAEKDPMYEMHEQEKKDIWASREYFRVEAPELLPKLLSCVEWGERAEAASVAHMVAGWPLLRVECALELLDSAYADAAVRSFAVKCLAEISADECIRSHLVEVHVSIHAHTVAAQVSAQSHLAAAQVSAQSHLVAAQVSATLTPRRSADECIRSHLVEVHVSIHAHSVAAQVSAQSHLAAAQVSAQSHLVAAQVSAQSHLAAAQVSAQSHLAAAQVSATLTPRRSAGECTLTPRRSAGECTLTPRRSAGECTITPRHSAGEYTITPRRSAGECTRSHLVAAQVSVHSHLVAAQVSAHSHLAAAQVSAHSHLVAAQVSAHSHLVAAQVNAHSHLVAAQVSAQSHLAAAQVSAQSHLVAAQVSAHSHLVAVQVSAQSHLAAAQVSAHSHLVAAQVSAHAHTSPQRRDENLLLYLLQLVQALKHESYLMCDLSVFLLQRAFSNMTIGHFLFWHLRSEMHVPAVSVRFGLMLEAYCRGCQDHINSLMRQITCLDKLKWASQCVRKKKEISKARAALHQHLQEQHCMETLCDFVSPLTPSLICKKIKPERCRVMDSKMRPLMLEFENVDPTGSDIRIILKIGDDLRQDMFTLQMLRIMDRLWKNAGYDFRLNPYNCISMEYAVGMIEVVDDAETVANIQKQSALFNAASTIYKANLFQWLKKQNPTESGFNKAVEEFTMSCAGYCVATYVLGIADRHPDNIMVKKCGQLFHIDFGHFLGHFKQKYGFKRERVPFVLTHDFIHVINKGQRGSGVNEALDFKIFKEHCETAFKILRKHGHLILSLFSMMISTGLPELRSEKDLQYLRETLVMDLSEEKALEHFRLKFIEAVKNSWKASVNWAIHNIDKNN
ncbi:unnamed protein product [Parnassius apollo]|uniref:phosphatidylinositol 3-kinase n=1 Tax=Parnassius apollo TaxID=110799 RepID=A0A8S3X9X0_PARAO|nr:unnamed protein product [Parnassius apollo]